MAETRIPGIKAGHAVITPNCRRIHGGPGAYEEACRRLREHYESLLVEGNRDADIHLTITVQRPRKTN